MMKSIKDTGKPMLAKMRNLRVSSFGSFDFDGVGAGAAEGAAVGGMMLWPIGASRWASEL